MAPPHPCRLFLVAVVVVASSCKATGSTGGEDGGPDASFDGDGGGDAGLDGGSDGGGAHDGSVSGCDLDSAQPPWPDWVPAWPGSGRNASGHTTFRVLENGPTITGLRVESLAATSAVLAWTTPGDTDSSVAWGPTADSCPTGYRRTGARRDHRMLVGPLEPGTNYFAAVRSRDDTSADSQSLSFTTTALAAATELSSCSAITSPGSYRLTSDVTGGCTCFDIQASGVTLDLGWHTVTYAQTDTASQCHGVFAQGAGIEVARGIIVQGAAGGDLYSHGIKGNSSDGLELHQLWIRVRASDAHGIRAMFSQNVSVHDVVLVSEVRDVTDRHYPGNRGISLDLSGTGARGEVYDCALFGVPHWGILMTNETEPDLTTRPTGGQIRRISGNHVFADMHATNGYAIGVAANDIEVDHNEIRPLYNGRAIHYTGGNGYLHHNIVEALERIAGDPAQGFSYYSDLMDPESPHDIGTCTWVVAHGIRVENGCFGVIAQNEVYSYSLPNVTFGATGINVDSKEGSHPGDNEIHHNQVTAFRDPAAAFCDEWGGPLPTTAGWAWGYAPASPTRFHDNRFVSNVDKLVIEDPTFATSTSDELVDL